MGLYKRAILLPREPPPEDLSPQIDKPTTKPLESSPAGSLPSGRLPAESFPAGGPPGLPPVPAAQVASVEAERLFADIAGLEEGEEAPARFFQLLQKAFPLTRSALLLYDPARLVFAPWTGVGFDETTLHRLRIPLGFNQKINRAADGETLTLRGEADLADFSRFFSTREFATLSGLVFVPLIHEQKLIALLLIARADLPGELPAGEPPGPAAELLAEACRAAAPLIHRSREARPDRRPDAGWAAPPAEPGELKEALRALAEECRRARTPLLLIRICLSTAAEAIRRKNSFIDGFRIHEDLSRIIASLLSGIGRTFRLDPDGLLLAVTRMPEADPALLLRHLSLSLRGFFLELEGKPEIRFGERVRTWPLDGPEVEKLLQELL